MSAKPHKHCVLALALAGALLPTAAWGQAKPQAGRSAGPVAKNTAQFDDLAKRAAQARDANHLDEAIDLYHKAVQLNPKWDEGWWCLGTLLYEKDDYPDARDAFNILLNLQPTYGPAAAMLGLCEFQTKEYERALDHLRKARALGLGDKQEALTMIVRYHTGLLLTRFERFEAALDALAPFARQEEKSGIIEAFGLNALRMPFLPAEMPPDKRELVLMAGRAVYYMAGRRAAEASKSFEQLVTRYPGVPNVHYAYGVFLLPDQPDAALVEFRRELEISPTDLYAILQIAFEYIRRADYAAGLPFAEKAVALAKDQPPCHDALGRILVEMDQTDRGIQELELAAKLGPESPRVHFALAHAYAKVGRKADAKREREAFTRLDNAARAEREGPQSIGGTGVPPKSGEKEPR